MKGAQLGVVSSKTVLGILSWGERRARDGASPAQGTGRSTASGYLREAPLPTDFIRAVALRPLAYGIGEWPKGFVFDNRLSLNGLKSITPEVAGELARYQGPLRLDGLRELPPDVAEALSAFNPQCTYDRLKLNGLRRLSPEAARKLIPFRATLCLGGLRTVSPELAEALVEVRGRILLQGVTRLSYESAGILLSRLEVNLSPCVW